MYKIVGKEQISDVIYKMVIDAPHIASKRKAGQFVVIRPNEKGERIPLTIAGSDTKKGTVDIIFQAVGGTTNFMAKLEVGDMLLDVVGPLGHPTHIENFGHTVCIGGGLGIALVMPITEALFKAGNKVTAIISGRDESLLLMEDEMRAVSHELKIATDDGSKGTKGFPTVILQQMIDDGIKIDMVVAVGPVPLMGAISKLTEPYKIKTVVSLNPIMVDGTGMCGGCRVTIGGKTKFACIDGPEFDGHQVDFKELWNRLKTYPGDKAELNLKYSQPAKHCWEQAEKDFDLMTVDKGDRVRKPRQSMPQQEADIRARNFAEVPHGLNPELAKLEAGRCLQCKKPLCVLGCPVGVDIPGFIKLIADGDFVGAGRKLKETNSLPAVCGRVCPQEDQCEMVCMARRRGKSVAIGNLERFAADYEMEHAEVVIPEIAPSTGFRIAIVGGGPAGLTAAGELVQMGHEVTIFEALHRAGGVLVYGIPEFRLPKIIVEKEVDYLKKMGVKIVCNYVVGKADTVDDLLDKGYDAVFLGTGAGLPMFMGIPGENLNGVFSANDYLTRVNLMKAFDPEYATPILTKKRVAIFGAGNVAMDAGRTALRLGAEDVYMVYRRSRNEMPARIEEIHHGEEEGIQFKFLVNPLRILGDDKGWVTGLELIRMELGEPDDSGRRRPVPIKGSEFTLDVDSVVVSIGQGPHPLVPSTTPGLKTTKWGNIVADEETGITSREGVFAGGDIVTGAATVILAMGAGKLAAKTIDNYVRNKKKKDTKKKIKKNSEKEAVLV
ncbi:MAG: NADPH-dependent glutamate synthase [Candidatus Anammoxibacter sp.]